MSLYNPTRAANTTAEGSQTASRDASVDMQHFGAALAKATAKGANDVPGAVMGVVNKDGEPVYTKVSGFDGVAEDAAPLTFDATYFLASCTKLIGSIAGLQVVERGLIGLDDDLSKHLPELTEQPVITAKGEKDFDLKKATKPLTLRHLITHSSGAAYDLMDPTLIAWRQSRGETPNFSTSGVVARDYVYPRTFEAGEGWMYGTGLDWTSLLVSRLSKQSFEEYVEENIAKPLGIASFTWHLPRKPQVAEKLMRMSERQEDGTFKEGAYPIWPDPEEEAGGAGMYSNVKDYMLVLADLLKDSPVVLKKETVDQMFTPQFKEGSAAQRAMAAQGDWTWGPVTGRSTEGVVPNHGLGGFLATADIQRPNYLKPKGTLSWSGMPNLAWNINRERGLATMYATQVMPWNDAKSQALSAAFETAVWKNLLK